MNVPTPGDPSYNAHGRSRYDYYGIAGIPDGRMNGKKLFNVTQSAIDSSKMDSSTVAIAASLIVSDNIIQAKATITPYVTSTVTIHQALIQDYYTYDPGFGRQSKYYFVMRKMNPDGGGAKNVAMTDGVPFNVSFDHTAVQVTKPVEGSFDFWAIGSLTYQYVVYVQDEQTKEVLNSGSGLMTTAGIVTLKDDASIGVYPNPAEDYAIVGIQLKKESKLSLTIYDISGKAVYYKDASSATIGQNEITINTSHFAPGIYTIVVVTKDAILREKLMIN